MPESSPARAPVLDRLRLFHFTAADGSLLYLCALRAFALARERYQARLHLDEVSGLLNELRTGDPTVPEVENLGGALDQLVVWGLLLRAQDTARVATLAEYRRRNSVYQLTETGWLAWRAVEDVLGARLDETELRRLLFASVLEDLRALAAANRRGDDEQVAIRLGRLHDQLEDLSRRSNRFYLALDEIQQRHEVSPEDFLRLKDRLLAHLDDFLRELQRYKPLLLAAVHEVEGTDVAGMVVAAARAERAPLLSAEEQAARLARRWQGVVAWFCPPDGSPSTADQIERHTARAIADLVALLRRVTERRRGGVSRESALRGLARQIWSMPGDNEASALMDAVFALGGWRHLGVALDDPEAVSTSRSWWEAPAAPVATTLRERGQAAAPGRMAAVVDDASAREYGRQVLRKRRMEEDEAGERLAREAVLDRGAFALLLRLLNRALRCRQPVSGTVEADLRAGRIRLRLAPAAFSTTVRCEDGVLVLERLSLRVEELSA